MSFMDEVEKRDKLGQKYTGDEHWDNWDDAKFLKNAQEELVDCFAYLGKIGHLSPLIVSMMNSCITFWESLEIIKKEVSKK